ncbi:MAG: SMC family ATPase, partial [Actinomycetota bacterium]|nr:SMC family ATPase [Actinomycetota bacterium]
MRPLGLKLKGFTSFRDEQEIEFRDLDLFALWGPTGSGKSSILDAITYALYGKVERVEGVRGETLAGLITHGQPRLAVTLDFECHDKAFRITRTTSHSGPTKVRLERREGEDWVTYGEGADSVREVNKIVPRIVGLDYDAFTRSVLLPQGKFAEFLVGDAAQRREILTELLGLELFGRMAQRANEIARDAKSNVEATARVLETEYEGVDSAAVAQALEEAGRVTEAARIAAEAETALERIEEEWSELNETIEQLVALHAEVDDVRSSYERHATALERHERDFAAASTAADAAKEKLDDLRATSEGLTAERTRAEDEHGTLEELARMKAVVESLNSLQREVKRAENIAAQQQDLRASAEKELRVQDQRVKKADQEYAAAQVEAEQREAEHDRAHRADLVGALTHALSPGDPCPVCERPLDDLPTTDASDLKRANEARTAAQQRLQVAQEALSSARVAQARAAEAVEAAGRRCSECAAEVELKKSRLEEVRAEIADAADFSPEQRLQEIAARAAELRDLVAREKQAAAAYSSAMGDVAAQQEALSRITTKIAGVRGAIEAIPLKPLLVQVKRALGRSPKVKVPTTLPESVGDLVGAVRGLCDELKTVLTDLADESHERREHASALVAKAHEALPPGIEIDAEDIKSLVAQMRGAARSLGQQAALAEKEAKTLRERLDKRQALEAEVAEKRKEQAVYAQLQRELKNDRIVQFLQAEALAVLAAVASE